MDGAQPIVNDEFGFNTPEAISAIQKLDLKPYTALHQLRWAALMGGAFRALAREGERFVAIQPWNSWAIATVTGEGVNHAQCDGGIGDPARRRWRCRRLGSHVPERPQQAGCGCGVRQVLHTEEQYTLLSTTARSV